MSNNLTLADAINEAKNTGRNPPGLENLSKLSASSTIAAGTTATAVENASTTHNLNSTFSDTEAEAALNALGTKLNSILAALREFKIIST